MDGMNQQAQQVNNNPVNSGVGTYQAPESVNSVGFGVNNNAGNPTQGGSLVTAEGQSILTNPAQAGVAPAGQQGQPTGAPEKYETFKVPEGMETFQWDDAKVAQFHEIAKGLNLPQDQAQKIWEFGALAIKDAQEAQLAETMSMIKAWEQQSKADPAVIAVQAQASRLLAMTDTADKQVSLLLDQTGIGSHPAFIKWLGEIAKMVGEDPFNRDNGRGNAEPTDDSLHARAQRMFSKVM